MASLSRIACVCLAGLVLSVLPAESARAQEARTLTIQNGTVYLDGRALSPDRLPASLTLDGVQAHYRFLGIQEPVVEIGGQLYAVNETLEPVSEDEARRRNASVILQGGMQQPQALRPTREPSAGTRASDLQKAHQQYLQDLQQHSHSLYERIMRERKMEAETRELARVIRLLPEGSERQGQIDTLRATLNKIFELKQDNRLREIEKLQNQIMELQRSLQEREQMREAMIDQRMKQLIGASGKEAPPGE